MSKKIHANQLATQFPTINASAFMRRFNFAWPGIQNSPKTIVTSYVFSYYLVALFKLIYEKLCMYDQLIIQPKKKKERKKRKLANRASGVKVIHEHFVKISWSCHSQEGVKYMELVLFVRAVSFRSCNKISATSRHVCRYEVGQGI